MAHKHRIKELILSKEKNIKSFCEDTGYSRDTLNAMFKHGSEPKLSLCKILLKKYPKLNPYWLIMNEGNIWLAEEAVKLDGIRKVRIEERVNELENKQQELEEKYDLLKQAYLEQGASLIAIYKEFKK